MHISIPEAVTCCSKCGSEDMWKQVNTCKYTVDVYLCRGCGKITEVEIVTHCEVIPGSVKWTQSNPTPRKI
jgi:hypothetical protein